MNWAGRGMARGRRWRGLGGEGRSRTRPHPHLLLHRPLNGRFVGVRFRARQIGLFLFRRRRRACAGRSCHRGRLDRIDLARQLREREGVHLLLFIEDAQQLQCFRRLLLDLGHITALLREVLVHRHEP